MDYSSLIYTVGATGVFASRAFMPAFFTALVLRFGPEITAWAGVGLIPKVPAHGWFTSDAALIILGVFALLEFVATKDADIRQMMDEVDHWIKSGMAMATTLGVLSVADRNTLEAIQGASPAAHGVMAAGAGGVVFWLATIRKGVLDVLVEADGDDSLGLQRLLGWCEDGWVFFAVLMLFVLPLVTLVLLAVAAGALVLLRKILAWREAGEKGACTQCGAMIYPCARSCPACRHPNPSPCRIGFLGTSLRGTTSDPAIHEFRLREKKRCPQCATRLRDRQVAQNCPACGTRVFADGAAMAAYDAYIRRRYHKTMVVTSLLGLVPVLGLVAGVIWYRTQLVAPYRRYVPRLRCFGMRLLLDCLKVLLLAIQWIPVVGWFSLPLMASISHAFHRRAFRQQNPAVS